MEFTRVVDEAGALTHQDRRELMRALEDLERNIPPIALCIYITADGQAQELRSHAHWALNHARIHHPSFGRREKMRAIEDAEFAELRPGESPESRSAPTGVLSNLWQKLRTVVRDALHPYPPPVQREWMLILVLDVQLEMACFAWGYMLDPYINPDSINSCIMSARLQFRERAMAVGLRKVMKAAVSQIAAQSHSVNRRLQRSLRLQGLALILSLGMLSYSSWAAPVPEAPTALLADDDVAEEVEDDTQPPPPPSQEEKASDSGAPASAATAPRWQAQDYSHLLSGELVGGYKMLLSAPQPTVAPAAPRSPRNREPDNKISKHFYKEYSQPGARGLIDPQKLLSNVERSDIEHELHVLNAHAPYRMYIAIFKQGQEIPLELAVGSLVRAVADPGQYATMIMYGLGDTPKIELGYHEIHLTDADRHAWLEKVSHAALTKGGGVDGLLAAMTELHTCLRPITADLPPLTQRTTLHVPLIPIEMREDEAAEEITLKDELKQMLENPSLRPAALTFIGIIAAMLLIGLAIWVRRRSGHLYKTEPDTRLSSPYGAGVSRSVRYLEGKELQKSAKTL